MVDPLPAGPAGSPDPLSTSSGWLDRLKLRDGEAWRRLAHVYGPLLYAWTRRQDLQPPDAADVVQEVFQAVAGAVGDFERTPEGTFRGWLWTITQNKIRDHFRRSQGQPAAAGGSSAQQRLQEVPWPDRAEPSEPGDTARLLRRVLERIRVDFEESTWQAFWQAAVEGHSPVDVAVDLGLSADAVRQAKSRILRRLRAELGDLFP